MTDSIASVEDLIRRARISAASQRHLPESTYRLQFHKGFTFKDATALVPYLSDLGITHIYASPYLRAAAGSTHGYDVIDHCRLNPEVGTDEDFDALLAALKSRGMSHILDTVPNHVGIATNDNAWWNDVLENGPASRYASFFDIEWRSPVRPTSLDRLLLPFLGGPYAEVLEKGELRLVFEKEHGSFALFYHDRRFPISPRTYGKILSRATENLGRSEVADERTLKELPSIAQACARLPDRTGNNPQAVENRHLEKDGIKARLAALASENKKFAELLESTAAHFNGTAGDSKSFDALDDLIQHQCYRLTYWHVASPEINYRRFFDINDLAALSMQRTEVFERTHVLILKLLADGKIAGLRIDHPDGLYDPAAYFIRLQRHYLLALAMAIYDSENAGAGSRERDSVRSLVLDKLNEAPTTTESTREQPLYVTVEKILAVEEPLPTTWAVAGTSGYDFLIMVNGLFVDPSGEAPLTRLYSEWTGDSTSYEDLVYRNKKLMLRTSLSSELNVLASQLDRLAQRHRSSLDFTLRGLSDALLEVIACFPVYRTYVVDENVSETDRSRIEAGISTAIRRNPRSEVSIFHFIRDVLLQHSPTEATADGRAASVHFAGKFQQLTSPVTAKGIEDTTFYQYDRFISLNEVGGDPDQFGVAPADLHGYLSDRQRYWPHAMSTLSTHDTKRSEDVRARLNVLSEIPEEWTAHVTRWREINSTSGGEGRSSAPSAEEEYLIYQTLVGAWPAEGLDGESRTTFVPRIQAYLVKAMREAKLRTNWADPDADHEKAVGDFIARILNDQTGQDFLADFRTFQQRVARFGNLNSLSQTLLKLTAPGIPDTYQGSELMDFSLVDPDNRRPVDYEHRRRVLSSMDGGQSNTSTSVWNIGAGQIDPLKMLIHLKVLRLRRDHPGLLSLGEYLPLEVTGTKADHIFAFARKHAGKTVIVAVPRFLARLLVDKSQDPWGETTIRLSNETLGTSMTNVFSGEKISLPASGDIKLTPGRIFSGFPVALLVTS